MLMENTPEARLARARHSLDGVSVGDAFGERFFAPPGVAEGLIAERAEPGAPWEYTDDTLMALSVFSVLRLHGHIDQKALALSFAERYDYTRGYGPAVHRVLRGITTGDEWRELAASLFEGQGSYGNGGAMRVAPLGAYFADDLHAAVEEAARSAEITHLHDEAIAGSIAVAVAAAQASRLRAAGSRPSHRQFLDLVLPFIPESEVRSRVRRAREIGAEASPGFAVAVLGNGVLVSAQDTVPYALWCAARWLDNYEEALWLAVGGLGDRDTTCAIAGGIVAAYTGSQGIPARWLAAREALPEWAFA